MWSILVAPHPLPVRGAEWCGRLRFADRGTLECHAWRPHSGPTVTRSSPGSTRIPKENSKVCDSQETSNKILNFVHCQLLDEQIFRPTVHSCSNPCLYRLRGYGSANWNGNGAKRLGASPVGKCRCLGESHWCENGVGQPDLIRACRRQAPRVGDRHRAA